MSTQSTALNLIGQLSADLRLRRAQPFLAPLLAGGAARLRVAGLILHVPITDAQPGWWTCAFTGAQTARIVDAALPYERGDYLALWPALRLVLLEPLAHGDWLAMPFNAADAAQRFRLPSPVVVRLVEGGQPFARVVGRVEGTTVWYDALDRRADPRIAEALRAALDAGLWEPGIVGLAPGERAAYALLRDRQAHQLGEPVTRRHADPVRHALQLAGATLLGYEILGPHIRVIWERADERGVTLVTPELEVVSAGICLNGTDRQFDLTSIVGVVADAPGFARAADGDDWDD